MTLLALGINHKTAPVSLRERVTFSPDTLDQALDSLQALPMVQGGVVLSTCNRTEIYLSVEEQDNLREALIRWLCEYHNLNEEDLRNSLYWHQDNDAVSHLMRVASGLDSLVLGEPQILGQVKKAFADSQKGHQNASALERMFQKSFSVAKRVRTETDIGASAVSVAFAACTLARQIFESLSTVTVLLVGAGETIELVARHLREHKVKKMIIANRTRERAQVLADEVGAEVISLSDIDARLQDADIIISSTASPLPIIGKGMVERALKNRRNQPMLLVDIAVPRDVEPEVGKLSNAYLYSVDDLQSIISHNLAQRKAAAVEAETPPCCASWRMHFRNVWCRPRRIWATTATPKRRSPLLCWQTKPCLASATMPPPPPALPIRWSWAESTYKRRFVAKRPRRPLWGSC